MFFCILSRGVESKWVSSLFIAQVLHGNIRKFFVLIEDKDYSITYTLDGFWGLYPISAYTELVSSNCDVWYQLLMTESIIYQKRIYILSRYQENSVSSPSTWYYKFSKVDPQQISVYASCHDADVTWWWRRRRRSLTLS